MNSHVQLSVVNERARIGCKGPGAAEWLRARAVPVPAAANTIAAWGVDGGLVARLGSSEFFIEAAASAIAALNAALAVGPAGVYPVLREDAAFTVEGPGVHDALAQICHINFAALDLVRAPVVMTLMIGVAVLVVPEAVAGGRRYRIWCDPSFGEYLEQQFNGVVGAAGATPHHAAGVI